MEVLAEYEIYTSFSIDLNQIRTEINRSTYEIMTRIGNISLKVA